MSSCSELRSHNNKKLTDHLFNVGEYSKTIFNELCIKNKNLCANLSFLIGISHDFAKSTTFFQEKLETNNKNENANHGFLSAIFGYYVIKEYLTKNHPDYLYFSTISFLVILKHHGNLSNVFNEHITFDKKIKIANIQIDDLKSNLNKSSLNQFYLEYGIDLLDFFNSYEYIFKDLKCSLIDMSFKEHIDCYFLIILFYSVLLDADKMDASETNFPKRINLSSNLVDIYKFNKFDKNPKGVNKIREEAYCEVNNNIINSNLNNKVYSIELPTGAGKTLTAFSAALKLRDKINKELSFTPRIIYSLPFLSIIDQNEKVFNKILYESNLSGSNVMLKHSYLADMNYDIEDEDDIGINNVRLLIEGWNSEIVLTTFIQFFYSLISNKNKSLRKFHNISNSIIILDEIQSIPHRYWKIVNLMLNKLACKFNSWIILMTATQPLIFSKEEIIPLVNNKKYYYDSFDRVTYNFNLNDVSMDDFKIKILDDLTNNDDKDFMFIMNTIDSSKDIYSFIKDYFESRGLKITTDNKGIVSIEDDLELIYLSTNIIPKHRLYRINHIKKYPNKRHIIVSTQLVEAGVDISVDIIYRDFAPIDSIIQSAGRCNRNNTADKGVVNVVSLVNENNKKYSNFVYDYLLLEATRNVLKDKNSISENEFNMISSMNYFRYLKENGSDNASIKLIKIIRELNFEDIPPNFKLIKNSVEKIDVFVEIDDESSSVWKKFNKIRNIKNKLDKNNEFLLIKSKFYENIVSVPIEKLGSTIIISEWLGYLNNLDISRKYDLELGFIASDDENLFIINI